MSRTIQFQDPGEGIHDGEVVELHVSPGDTLEKGQVVLVVETDKANFEVESPASGRVEKLHVEVGDTIEVGQVLATLASEGASEGAGEDAGREGGSARREASPRRESEEDDAAEAQRERSEAGPTEDGEDEERSRRSSREGPDDERSSARAEPARRRGEGEAQERRDGDDGRSRRDGRGPVPASPATRRLARDLGVDLHAVRPSGEEGRVLAGDVRAHAAGAAGGRGELRGQEPAEAAGELPDFSRFGPTERAALRSVRRTTARRMAQAWRSIPHVTHEDEADITALEALRRRQSEATGEPITLTALVLKAAASVLREFPRFNASLDSRAEELVYKHYRHIGVAVDTDRGLLVPVVRDVDAKSVREIGRELADLSERARAGKLRREDLSGGSFTLTNVGALGGRHLSPLINPPQVAILGLARACWEPRAQAPADPAAPSPEARVEVRLVLPLCLTFDHRVNDGADAARFVNRLVGMLSDPERLAVSL